MPHREMIIDELLKGSNSILFYCYHPLEIGTPRVTPPQTDVGTSSTCLQDTHGELSKVDT
uniref:Uncharacterized protein n=1 Tax=Nelumbo nucifera TaxID=4432 RepID=A0A822ZLA0_NELNU|nr:TPA_asm: hypothetical protein HUJ06_003917 [Nelumbo nucifera]